MIVRQYQSIRRNNGKYLKSRMRRELATTSHPVSVVEQPEQNDLLDFDKKVLESITSLNTKYPKLYNVMAQFNIIDTDGNGHINVFEFAQLMTWLGYTYRPNVITQLFDIADVNGDKTINLNEFLEFYKNTMLFKKSDRYLIGTIGQEAFSTLMKKFDVNITNDKELFTVIAGKDTQIDLQEFLSFHKYFMMFKQIDSDGSGSITFDEFYAKFPNSTEKFRLCVTNNGSLDIVEFITCMCSKQVAHGGSSRRRKYANKLRKSRNSYY